MIEKEFWRMQTEREKHKKNCSTAALYVLGTKSKCLIHIIGVQCTALCQCTLHNGSTHLIFPYTCQAQAVHSLAR